MKAREPSHSASPSVEIELHEHLSTAIVTLRGEHDLHTQPRVSEALCRASEQPRVLVDLSECTFADSSLITAVISARAEADKRDGRVEVILSPEAHAVRRIAELCQLSEIVPIHSTREVPSTSAGGETA
jgi:anti-anti-sigma factor